jgi:hypothetical protein
MNKFLFVIVAVEVFLAFNLKAQDAGGITEQLIADIFEQYAAESDEALDFETFYDDLMALSQNPVQINSATREDFERIPFLSDIQIENLLFYLYRYGPMQTIYELQLVEGLDMTDIRRMLPFVVLGSTEKKGEKIFLNEVFRYGRSEMLVRMDYTAEKRSGYLSKEFENVDGEKYMKAPYSGSPIYNSLRYRFNYRNRVQFGITTEKDAGEQFIRKGYDFFSAFAQLDNIGKVYRAVFGDFRANFGMGLVLHPDFSVGKSAYVTNVVPKNRGLKKFGSTDEYNFFRGAGVTLRFGKMDVTAFYSNKKIDGDTLGGVFPSIYKTGLHRTDAEIAKRKTVTQQVAGFNTTINFNRLQLGITAVNTVFDAELQPAKSVYNYHYFSGKQQTVAGLNYRFRLRNFNFFGETALSDRLAPATINGVSVQPVSTVSLIALYRYFSPEYDTFYANTFSESTRVNNESGFYLGAEVRPFRKWKISAYTDSYRFAWPKFTASAPSNGMDYLLQADYAPQRRLNMYWRLRYEDKLNNFAGNAVLPELKEFRKTSLRYQMVYTFGNFAIKSLIEVNFSQIATQTPDFGASALQDVSYAFSTLPLKIDFRYQFFDAANYDNRFYLYEKDVLYAFSIPMFYGTGSRYYVNVRYDINRKLSIWFKAAQTRYADARESIGSGNDLITGNKKTDFRMLVRWEF